MSLIPHNTHPSWKPFLDQWVITFLNETETQLGHEVNPSKEFILRFLTTDLDHCKVVILGQDPYPEKGVATGRAFEVGTLRVWNKPFKQISLKNIIRLIYKTYENIEHYQAIPPYSQIMAQMASGAFTLLSPDLLFKSWEDQGVLLLNTWLSIKPSEPGSHRKLWQPFSERLLTFISSQRSDLCWFLWGKNAIENKNFIRSGRFFESRHPMMCSDAYADDFLKSNCFKATMSIIDWKGK